MDMQAAALPDAPCVLPSLTTASRTLLLPWSLWKVLHVMLLQLKIKLQKSQMLCSAMLHVMLAATYWSNLVKIKLQKSQTLAWTE